MVMGPNQILTSVFELGNMGQRQESGHRHKHIKVSNEIPSHSSPWTHTFPLSY